MKIAVLRFIAAWLLFVDLVTCDIVQGDNFCSELMCVTAFVNSSMVTCKSSCLYYCKVHTLSLLRPRSIDGANPVGVDGDVSTFRRHNRNIRPTLC